VILVFGFGVAMVIGFLSLRLLRIPCLLDLLVWGIIFGVLAVLVAIGVMFKYATAAKWKAQSPQVHSDAEIVGVDILGDIFLAFAAVWACIICCLRRRIAIAVGITKEASKALGSMTVLALFPVIQTVGLLAFCCVW